MNRLQKKCLAATAGTHLLLVVLLLCSGFIVSKPKPDDSQVLDVIPANLIDAALNSGVRGAKPPPSQPIANPPEPQPPQPPQPTPPPQPPPQPVVKTVEPVKPVEKIQPEAFKPVERTEPKRTHEVTPNLKLVVRNRTADTDRAAAEAEKAAKAAARAAQREREARARAFQDAARAIEKNASSSTEVELPPGNSTQAYANYASVVKSVYTQAWTPPNDAANDEANVKVSVTIANDGHVVSARVIQNSGDAGVDRSVQRTLDRVTDLPPFPDGSTDKERTYIINFNLKAKRMLG